MGFPILRPLPGENFARILPSHVMEVLFDKCYNHIPKYESANDSSGTDDVVTSRPPMIEATLKRTYDSIKKRSKSRRQDFRNDLINYVTCGSKHINGLRSPFWG